MAKHGLIVLTGINHSFIGKTPGQTRDANLKALAAAFQFIDRTIGNASSTTGSLSQRGGSQSVIRNRLISFGTNK